MAVFYSATTAIRSRFCGPLLLRVLHCYEARLDDPGQAGLYDHDGIRRDPVIADVQSKRDSIDLAQWHSTHSFRFGGRSAAKRGTQTFQRLIRVP
jgi:hypothetical protein